MDEQQTRQALHEIAQQEIPDNMDMWPQLHEQVERASRWARLAPKTRLGWVTTLLALMFTFVAGAYAVDFIAQVIGGDPGLEEAREANLITNLNLTQQVNDKFSVTLNWAYADANRIAINYTYRALVPVNQMVNVTGFTLRDDTGREFNGLFGGGGGGGGGGPEQTEIEIISSGEMSYDASIIEGNPETLNLELVLTFQRVESIPVETTPPPDVTAEASTGSGGGGGGGFGFGGGSGGGDTPPLMMQENVVETYEPVVFTFSLPFIPARLIEANETQTVNDTAVTLETVAVAPSYTNLRVCSDVLTGDPAWYTEATLNTGDGVLPLNGVSDTEDGCLEVQFSAGYGPSHESAEEWTLTIHDFAQSLTPEQQAQLPVLIGAEVEARGLNVEVDEFGGYAFSASENPGVDINMVMQEISQAAVDQLETSIDGPWMFTFTVPGWE